MEVTVCFGKGVILRLPLFSGSTYGYCKLESLLGSCKWSFVKSVKWWRLRRLEFVTYAFS
jgi:hypothetical protein